MTVGPEYCPAGVSQKRWAEAQKGEADWWRAWLAAHPDGNDDEWLALVARQFGIEGEGDFGGQVLVDVGGGPIGLLTKLNAARRIVVDPQDTPSIDPTIERIKAPGESIPLDEAIADAVFLYNVLQHVRDPREVLDECSRLTKPGGRVFVLEQLYVPSDELHPHILTERLFELWTIESAITVDRWEIERDRSFETGPRPGEAVLTVIARRSAAGGEGRDHRRERDLIVL